MLRYCILCLEHVYIDAVSGMLLTRTRLGHSLRLASRSTVLVHTYFNSTLVSFTQTVKSSFTGKTASTGVSQATETSNSFKSAK